MSAATLSDRFPLSMRANFCARHIQSGSVFRLFVDGTNPPKFKILVILATCNDGQNTLAGCLYVNTEINTNCLRTPELQALQLTLPCSDHGFLTHDSFLDCSFLLEIPVQQIEHFFQADGDVYLGELPTGVLNTAKTMVASAKSISKKLREKFGLI